MKKFLILVCVMITCIGLSAAVNTDLDEAVVLKQAEKATLENYPDAHFVLLDDLIVAEYQEDGTAKTTDDYYVKMLDQDGVQSYNNLQLWYSTNYGKAEFLTIEIVDENGDKRKVDISKNFSDQVAPDSAAMNIYDESSRLVTVQVPGLKTGDILHIKSCDSSFKARMENQFSSFQSIQSTCPVLHYSIVIRGPESKPLKSMRVLDPVEGTYSLEKTSDNGIITYRFDAKDVPQIIPEPSMPPVSKVAMRWIVSTVGSWEEISRWYYDLTEPKMAVDDAIRDMTKKLTDGKTGEMEKIKAIFEYVSRSVRYMGVTNETNRPGYEPHDVTYTFSTMTGVCRDKAALIVAMLRESGINANMVLINVSRKLDPEVPIIYFNHAIAGVILEDGTHVLMDPTDETTKDLLPAYQMDKSYIMASGRGDTLKITPVIPASRNLLRADTDVTYDGEKYDCVSTLRFLGINDNAYRGFFLRANEKVRKDFLNHVVKNLSQSARVTDYTIYPEDLLHSKEPLSLKISYVITDMVIGDGAYRMMRLPRMASTVGMFNFILGGATLSERKYPLNLDFTSGVEEKITWKSECAEKINIEFIPESLAIEDAGFEFHSEQRAAGNEIIYEWGAALNKLEYSPDEYVRLKEHLGEIEDYTKKYIIIRK